MPAQRYRYSSFLLTPGTRRRVRRCQYFRQYAITLNHDLHASSPSLISPLRKAFIPHADATHASALCITDCAGRPLHRRNRRHGHSPTARGIRTHRQHRRTRSPPRRQPHLRHHAPPRLKHRHGVPAAPNYQLGRHNKKGHMLGDAARMPSPSQLPFS